MAYLGSEAYRLDGAERSWEQRDARPSFDVLEGGGADARVRQGVSPSFLALLRMVLALTCAVVALYFAQVSLTERAFQVSMANSKLQGCIDLARCSNAELKVVRESLAGEDRIGRLAITEQYGMVRATERDVVVLPDELADDATDGSRSDPASTFGSDRVA